MKEMYLVYYEGESGVQHTLLAESHEEAKNLKKFLESAGGILKEWGRLYV